MFKKLLSNLPFNPSLITQVSFYTKRMKQESALRRTAFVFMALTMVVQIVAVISPPQSSLAESTNDIVMGGFATKEQAVLHCLNGSIDFFKILSYYGVGCDTINGASTITIKSTDYSNRLDSLGRNPQPATNPKNGKLSNQYTVNIPGVQQLYMKNLWYWDTYSSSSYKVLSMINKYGQTIMIMYDCGNIVTIDKYTPPAPAPAPTPPPVVIPSGDAICVNLLATPLSDRTYRFKAQTAGSNYTASSYLFSFGDGTSNTITSSLLNATTEHTYPATNTYTAKVSINVRVQGATGAVSKTLQCQTTIRTTTPDVCPNIPGDQSNTSQCYACPEARTNTSTNACIKFDKTAQNNTQKLANANGTQAHAGDIITYTLKVTNTGSIEFKGFVVTEELNDVLEYADVVSLNGGQMDSNNVVSWPAENIASNASLTKQIVVKVKSPIPNTPVSSSDHGSYDLVMTNVFYDKSINIFLPETPVKLIERTASTLPSTGPGENLFIGSLVVMIMGYYFARTRLFATELTIVRQEYASAGDL